MKDQSSSGLFGMRKKWKKVTGQRKAKTDPSNSYVNSNVNSKSSSTLPKSSSKTASVATPSPPKIKRTTTKASSVFRTPSPKKNKKNKKAPATTLSPIVSVASTPPPPPSYGKRTRSKSKTKAKSGSPGKRHNPLDCGGGDNDDDSEVRMVSIDLSTPPMYSKTGSVEVITGSRRSKTSPSKYVKESPSGRLFLRVHDKHKSSNKSESRVVAKQTSSMMTPDMLETLGLSEVGASAASNSINNNKSSSTHSRREKTDKDKASNSDASGWTRSRPAVTFTFAEPSPPKLSRRKQQASKKRTTRERRVAPPQSSPSLSMSSSSPRTKTKKEYPRFTDGASWMYFADNDDDTEDNDTMTCSTSASSYSSSSETYETREDDEYAKGGYYQDKSAVDCDAVNNCDPLTAAQAVLTMPVTLGVLCVDNVFNTDFFDVAMGPIPSTKGSSSMSHNKENKTSDEWTIESIDSFREKRRKSKMKQRLTMNNNNNNNNNRGRLPQKKSTANSVDRSNTSWASSLPSLLV